MKKPLPYYTMLAKRWAWLVVLGIVLCSSATFTISKMTRPVYQASATLILNLGTPASSGSFNESVQAVPTYAQLLSSPTVLNPVVAQHPGLTLEQLSAMITVKPQSNTQLIELDVESSNPRLAMQLANEVSQSFARFSNAQLSGTIQILPAQQPTQPIRPKTLVNTAIGALVGLGLALALIVLFEWLDDRLANPEEVQELLGTEILAVIPQISRKQRSKKAEEIPAFAQACRMLCASLNVVQKVKPFKLVMVTSALPGEGKSSIASNLASFLAMEDKRVLLVDANLPSPALDQHFQLDHRPQLPSPFRQTWAEIEKHLDGQMTDIANLYLLTAGGLPSNSTGWLESPGVNQLFEHFTKAPFDYIIFDAPPLLSVADTQVLASSVQAVVLVVDVAKTPRKVLLRAKRMLDRTRTMILGVVINKSGWPEQGQTHPYLSDGQPPPVDMATARSIPRTASAMIKPPDTPAVNDLVDPDITITVPRQRWVKDNKSDLVEP